MRKLKIEKRGIKTIAYTIKDGKKSKELEINEIEIDGEILAKMIISTLSPDEIDKLLILLEDLK